MPENTSRKRDTQQAQVAETITLYGPGDEPDEIYVVPPGVKKDDYFFGKLLYGHKELKAEVRAVTAKLVMVEVKAENAIADASFVKKFVLSLVGLLGVMALVLEVLHGCGVL